jgi:hypothetical protein
MTTEHTNADGATQPLGVGSSEGLGLAPKRADFDFRHNHWGHALYGTKENADGSWLVAGCCLPRPKVGQTALLANETLWRFRSVDLWRDPRDGFAAVIEKA